MATVTERLAAPAGRLFVLTGAGLSVAAGLPTYRGTGGLYPSGALIPLSAHHATSRRVGALWDRLRDLSDQARAAEPTRAHQLLADKATAGWDVCVATQNVDGLYHRVDGADHGAYRVIDLHGSLLRARCINPACRLRVAAPTRPDPTYADGVPRCACGARFTCSPWAG